MTSPVKSGNSASSPSSAKQPQLEFSERDAAAGHAASNNAKSDGSKSSPSANGQSYTGAGGSPIKVHTPATAEHLRYGHVDFEEVEEAEEDKRRHYLLRKPKVKQWFYKGKLFRSAEGRASARIEL